MQPSLLKDTLSAIELYKFLPRTRPSQPSFVTLVELIVVWIVALASI